MASAAEPSFAAFFWRWSQRMRWKVPAIHWQMVQWLEDEKADVRVLLVFRGAAKSTIYAIKKAHQLRSDRTHRSLVWSEDTKLAKKMTRDVLHVLRNHPWCGGIVPPLVGSEEFWVSGSVDARNPSIAAHGVLSNATGSRAEAVDFDDIEVPKNIRTAEAREKLRDRTSEATHILVPGGQKTYIGTPHTHDSIYMEEIAGGAAVLKIPLFAHARRYENTSKETRYPIGFKAEKDGYYVFAGIGKFARLLVDRKDYQIEDGAVVFEKPPGAGIDIYAACAWPERFTRKDVERRRKGSRTLNAWDSQYMLEAKPLTETRLDPARLIAYEVEPRIVVANNDMSMWLGATQIVSATLRMDPASGKLRSNVSALCLVLQDVKGYLYWHRAIALMGELAEHDATGKVTGGQVMQICDVIDEFKLPRILVETNGLGMHVPAILRGALRQRKIVCGVTADNAKGEKNAAILAAFEPPLQAGFMWAHTSVLELVTDQMRDWNPAVREQPDDYLDAAARAILAEPVRIGNHQTAKILAPEVPQHWAPDAGTFEVEFER